MQTKVWRWIAGWVVGVLVVALAWAIYARLTAEQAPPPSRDTGPAPVAVAPIEQGPIVLRRTFSGTLESPGRFVAAPKVGGRVEVLRVDVSDPVRRGQVIAELDSDEYQQQVAQAEGRVGRGPREPD